MPCCEVPWKFQWSNGPAWKRERWLAQADAGRKESLWVVDTVLLIVLPMFKLWDLLYIISTSHHFAVHKMQPVVTDVSWSVCVHASVWLSVCPLVQEWAIQKWPKWSRCNLRYGLMGATNHVFAAGPDPPRGGAIVGRHLRAIVKYREYLAWGRYSPSFSVGGSTDVAFCCEYCSIWW